MEKRILIDRLLQDEPPYAKLAQLTYNEKLLEEILVESDDELRNRVVSLAVLLPSINPVQILFFAYKNGGVSTKAVTIGSLRKVDQIYFEDDRIKEILEDSIKNENSVIVKFAATVLKERRLKSFLGNIRHRLETTSDPYVRKILEECSQTF